MLEITEKHIFLKQHADNKQEAIKAIAHDLNKAGYVDTQYVTGMQAREIQSSTFLGHGIAIPHGTPQTKDLIKQTGVVIHHYPKGIQWDENNTVYLAIGIAAKSDEHLTILKQLTHLLSQAHIEKALQNITDEKMLIDLLNGKNNQDEIITDELLLTQFPATEMIQLQAIAAGLLHRSGFVEHEFIANYINHIPTYLGTNVWILSSDFAIKKTGIAIVSAQSPFEYQHNQAQVLIAVASNNQSHQSLLETLINLITNEELKYLSSASKAQIIQAFKTGSFQEVMPSNQNNTIDAEFIIKNPHGLHARPSKVLANETKKYQSTITVKNLSQNSETVNAKSLMKLMTLGAQSGHRLKFSASGDDAQEAIKGIENVINSGLGE